MKSYENIQNLIERADRLIRLKATGTSDEFATVLGISRSSVFRLLEYIKSIGAPVNYCNFQKTYYYEYPIKIEFTCKVLRLDKMQMNKIVGGRCLNSYIYKQSEIIFENILHSLKI